MLAHTEYLFVLGTVIVAGAEAVGATPRREAALVASGGLGVAPRSGSLTKQHSGIIDAGDGERPIIGDVCSDVSVDQ